MYIVYLSETDHSASTSLWDKINLEYCGFGLYCPRVFCGSLALPLENLNFQANHHIFCVVN